MQIPVSVPTVISSTQATTYDSWWVSRVTIQADDPANVTAAVMLRQCTFDKDGNPQFCPLPGATPIRSFTLNNVMQDANPAVQQAIITLIQAVAAKGQELQLL